MINNLLFVTLPVLMQVTNDDAWKRHEAPVRALIEELAAGRYEDAESRFNPTMKQAVPAEKLAGVMDPLRDQLGLFRKIASPRRIEDARLIVFEVVAQFEKPQSALQLTVAFDADGKIAGLRLLPKRGWSQESPPFDDYKTKTDLVLPFEGTWNVAHGGRTQEQNHHVVNHNQRYAYDFYILGDEKRSYRTSGTVNEDFFAYGQPVLAPGDGRIVQVVDGIKDNEPLELNPYFVPGNLVVIDHGNGEYSFLAHFQPGSIQVRVGDRVRQKQLLGRCGNSGNSSEPHIHYHLAYAPRMHQGDGLPAQFRKVNVNGKSTENVEVVKGSIVCNVR